MNRMFFISLIVFPLLTIAQQEKHLLKIVDILGKESKSKKGLLFYIYSDGTVEKKIIIE